MKWLVETFFLSRLAKQCYSVVADACLVKIWPDFFEALFGRFGSVLESLSIVCNFLLSSPRIGYEDSDSERESF